MKCILSKYEKEFVWAKNRQMKIQAGPRSCFGSQVFMSTDKQLTYHGLL
ncbi:hypothetical protein Hanom_Chr04g00287641 [Helianthus anomalus]